MDQTIIGQISYYCMLLLYCFSVCYKLEPWVRLHKFQKLDIKCVKIGQI